EQRPAILVNPFADSADQLTVSPVFDRTRGRQVRRIEVAKCGQLGHVSSFEDRRNSSQIRGVAAYATAESRNQIRPAGDLIWRFCNDDFRDRVVVSSAQLALGVDVDAGDQHDNQRDETAKNHSKDTKHAHLTTSPRL